MCAIPSYFFLAASSLLIQNHRVGITDLYASHYRIHTMYLGKMIELSAVLCNPFNSCFMVNVHYN